MTNVFIVRFLLRLLPSATCAGGPTCLYFDALTPHSITANTTSKIVSI